MDSVLMMCNLDVELVGMSKLVIIEVHTGCSFEDLLVKVCDIWPQLSIQDVMLMYSVPNYEKCRLSNEDDLRCLFRLVSVFSLKSVDVFVSSCSNITGNRRVIVTTSDTSTVSDVAQSSSGAECSSGSILMSKHWTSLFTGVGQKFYGGENEFRSVLNKYCTECGFEYRCTRNSKSVIIAICINPSNVKCKWSITSTIEKATRAFIVRKFDQEHSCDLEIAEQKGHNLKTKVIAELIEGDLIANPAFSASDVVKHLFTHFGYTVSYKKAWKAVLAASEKVFGEYKSSYQELRWWVAAAMYTNPGSHIVLEVNDRTFQFERLFVSFGACIQGFQYIRPMLFIDGTHLSGVYRGVLLCATGKTGNQGLYPLAYAVVDAENNENWQWFLRQLKYVVHPDRRLSFFSDRNLGILDGVRTVFPEDYHYFCIHHLKQNIKVKFSGSKFPSYKRERIVKLFVLCAYATTVELFDKYMLNLLQEGGQVIRDFLEGLPKVHWAKAFSVGCRYGSMSSSAIESFNSWVLEERALPVFQMVDTIRTKLMKWHLDRKMDSAKWTTTLCKGLGGSVRKRTKKSRTWVYHRSSFYNFEIIDGEWSFGVNVHDKACTCGNWQADNFPCDHAFACFSRCRDLKLHEFVDPFFFTDFYRMAYDLPINPVPSSLKTLFERNDLPIILPPSARRGAGRPPTKRIKSRAENLENSIYTCGRCKKNGHSKRSCKESLDTQ